MSSVDNLSDEEVITQFSQDEDSMEQLRLVLAGHKVDMASAFSDADCTDRQKELLREACVEVTEAGIREFSTWGQAAVLDVYTIEDMRSILRFREEYPQIHEKTKVFTQRVAAYFPVLLSNLSEKIDQKCDQILNGEDALQGLWRRGF